MIQEKVTIEELKSALKSTKFNKEPGPDLVRMELLRWLNKKNMNKYKNHNNNQHNNTGMDPGQGLGGRVPGDV